MNTQDELDNLIMQLIDYWRKHPNATDTIDGIQNWWLNEGRFSSRLMSQALESLVAQGVAMRIKGTDGRVRYKYVQNDQN